MWDWAVAWFNTFLDWIQAAWQWLLDVGLFVVTQVFIWILSAAASALEIIPAPDWLEQLSFAGINPTIVYFLEPFRIKYALGVIFGAYTIRFMIRRIPVIG